MRGILIIVLIALAIIVFLLTSKDSPSGETYTGRMVRALTQAEKLSLNSKITNIKRALEAYSLDNDKYPDTLDALVPYYLRIEEYIRDPWGERFKLETDEENHLILVSSGIDRVLGNDDDIERRLQ
ncbi:MAG: type II secretion system protein GspG [Candidatus Aminicenantes bacterium]